MRGEYHTAARQLPRIGVLLEQSLGHVTHGRNLQRVYSQTRRATVECHELPYEPRTLIDRLPPWSNWTVRSGLAARRAVRKLEIDQPLDSLIVHTQVPANLLSGPMRRIPTIVSLDATPKQIDDLGSSYGHAQQVGPIEQLKWTVHRRCFEQAATLVTWSKWAAQSLVDDYGVDRGRIHVIPPGAVASQWRRKTLRTPGDSTVRVLFVGGDFERKGGRTLLDAMSLLRADPEVVDRGLSVELHLVTRSAVPARPGVHVHNAMTPNSPELIALFHQCDLFALPTRGDCTPLVLAEAATAGLPVISTDVGAINESVLDGNTGFLVEPTVEGVLQALRPLVLDADLRLRMGANAARHAERTMDAEENANRLLDLAIDQAIDAAEHNSSGPRVLLTVSGTLDPDVEDDIEAQRRPLADYIAISRATNAELLDWNALEAIALPLTRFLDRVAGKNVAMAYQLWRDRHDHDVVITDGEQVGIPYAAFSRLTRRPGHHVMIGHRLSPLKKRLPIRLFGLASAVDMVLVYSSAQKQVAAQMFGDDVCLTDFMVDSDFFRSSRQPFAGNDERRPLLCTAGRESRDYPCLIEAVRGLDVDLVVASASPWSRRDDNAREVSLPDNVTVTALNQTELRELLDRADAVVVPLQPTDFQAGVTTVLEAMAMERPVVCSATEGQTDVVEDGVNGLYTPPGDVAAMRRTIELLLSDPTAAVTMGKRGRQLVEHRADVRVYADTFAGVVSALVRHQGPLARNPEPEAPVLHIVEPTSATKRSA